MKNDNYNIYLLLLIGNSESGVFSQWQHGQSVLTFYEDIRYFAKRTSWFF